MLKRLYVHNFRCLENFDLNLGGLPQVLLLGRNGAGKTTVGQALEVFQRIARGTSRVRDLVRPRDLTLGRTDVPARFQVETSLDDRNYSYSIVLDFPSGFRELRVAEENLLVDGTPIFTRELAQVRLARTGHASEAAFRIDWHVVALPIVQEQSQKDPLYIFKKWLANIFILRPIPGIASGESELTPIQSNTLVTVPDVSAKNIGTWFSGLVANAPSSYASISAYLAHVMPDFDQITNPSVGTETRSLVFHFLHAQRDVGLALEDLSDGERCFMIFALTIATNAAIGPIFCFWDEPDNFLAPAEVSQAVTGLRKAFKDRGQLILTSHNPETIRRFSDDNTLYLYRNSHLEPTIVTLVESLRADRKFSGSFIDALTRGDVDG